MGKSNLRYFCPHCSTEILPEDTICPDCNYDLAKWQPLDYEQKLIMALTHRDITTKMMAVYLLGEKKILQAIPHLKETYQQSRDPYFKAEILRALFKINAGTAKKFIQKKYCENNSIIVKNVMQDILARKSNRKSDKK